MPTAQLGVPHDTVTFPTPDGLRLTGWYVPSENVAAVILYPLGSVQRHARMLIDHGYGVILVAPRGYGTSEGDPNAWGWGADNDVHGAVDFLRQRTDVDPDRIGALGLSVGGEVLLHAAAENPALSAVVSEGAGARSWNEYQHVDGPARWLWAPSTITRMGATSVFSNRMPRPGLHDLVPKIAAPVVFIYASEPIGGEDLTEDYFLWPADPRSCGRPTAAPPVASPPTPTSTSSESSTSSPAPSSTEPLPAGGARPPIVR